MTWKPPETEEAWQECLSAYLDGEMKPDERRALEQYLEKDTDRARQLQEMRRLAHVLQEWRVEAPEPRPQFVREIEKVLKQETGSTWKGRLRDLFAAARLRWQFQAAVFVVGVLLGAFGAVVIRGAGFSAKGTKSLSQAPLAVNRPDMMSVTISPVQADGLLREVLAGNLKERVLDEIRNGNSEKALATYQALQESFSDTLVFRELEKDRRLLESKKLLASRRI
jgi:anti-sigma factor RsiW